MTIKINLLEQELGGHWLAEKPKRKRQTRAELRAKHRAAHKGLAGLKRDIVGLKNDSKGTVAVESAICLPAFIVVLALSVATWQCIAQNTATAYVAGAVASACGRALTGKAGAISRAQQAAQSVYSANAAPGGPFVMGSTPTLGLVSIFDISGAATSDDSAAATCGASVSATANSVFPAFGLSVFSASSAARS
jgi:Flp pilus assembly protein TadG